MTCQDGQGDTGPAEATEKTEKTESTKHSAWEWIRNDPGTKR